MKFPAVPRGQTTLGKAGGRRNWIVALTSYRIVVTLLCLWGGAGAENLDVQLVQSPANRITSYNVCYTKLLREDRQYQKRAKKRDGDAQAHPEGETGLEKNGKKNKYQTQTKVPVSQQQIHTLLVDVGSIIRNNFV